jgi:hypothetical protein
MKKILRKVAIKRNFYKKLIAKIIPMVKLKTSFPR